MSRKCAIMDKKIPALHETSKLGIFLSIELLIKGTFLGGYPDGVGIMMHINGETWLFHSNWPSYLSTCLTGFVYEESVL
jgi:hypothetical protein